MNFKYGDKHKSILNEGWFGKKTEKIVKDLWSDNKDTIKGEANKVIDELVAKHGPKVKKQAKKVALGLGGVTLVGSGVGSYVGTKVGNREKKIKESNIMLFPFTIGIHSVFARARGGSLNVLVQESVATSRAGIKKIRGVLSAEKLGQAMHKNPKTMEQAFRLYGPNSKTIKKAIPNAFGLLRKA